MVPSTYEQNKSLGKWVHKQRSNQFNNYLRLDRKDLLDEIEFVWRREDAHNYKSDDKCWLQQYEHLVEFKRQNGHCMVPSRFEQNKSLGKWVSTQRSSHTNDLMLQDRKDLLDKIGFAWKSDGAHKNKPDDKLWHQQCEKLVEFKRNEGHCMVPRRYEQNKSLGKWVSYQRFVHNKNNFRPDRKEILDGIGFVWSVERSEPGQGHVRNRFNHRSPNRKRPSAGLAEGGQMGARTKQKGKSAGSFSSVKEHGHGRIEEDSNPSLMTSSSAQIASYPDQEVVEEEATPGQIPFGWTRVKLEPDC
jgi:hypothetical protein